MTALVNNPGQQRPGTEVPTTIAELPKGPRQQELQNVITPLTQKVYDDLDRALRNHGPQAEKSINLQDGSKVSVVTDYNTGTIKINYKDREAEINQTPDGPTVSGMTTGEVAGLARKIIDAANPYGFGP